jgi:GalNAc-alpha-(1->4)-GalNAc-alpha-(1->3)-diNAcBac-PP-undecaprenol alpha-1,4-N-acetyl-D-galactosaminyltransferase
MKILIISPSLKIGGIERALTVIANEWIKKGFDISYISCLKGEPFYYLDPRIKLIEPAFKRTGGLLNKLMFYPKLLLYLRKTTKKISPDRVLVYGDWFSPITLLALRKTSFPVYISDRTIPEYIFKFPIPQLKQWLYPESAGFIAQTQRSKDFKIKLFGSQLRIQVIPNALPEFLDEHKVGLGRENKIIYVGRFAWEKDPEILIRTMALISKEHQNWKLEMAGTGPLLERMKILVKELNLESKVIFLGNVNNIAKLYENASILILPSLIEGFPNTLIEAMSFGLPCICFNDIPHEDIITDQTDGFVLEQRSPEILANSIEQLILNPKLRVQIGAKARKSVQRFEKEKITQELLAFMKL